LFTKHNQFLSFLKKYKKLIEVMEIFWFDLSLNPSPNLYPPSTDGDFLQRRKK